MITVYWKQAGFILVGLNVLCVMLLLRCFGNSQGGGWHQVLQSAGFSSHDSSLRSVDTHVDWGSISQRKKPNQDDMNDKWIVLTSIFKPTDDVKKLAKISGWKVVVVGDTKTPSDWSYDNCVYLGIEAQQKLGYNIVNLTPFKSYTRKNIGYLYAIEHGAKVIYETDDDNAPTNGVIEFDPELKAEYSSYVTTEDVVNPYSYFGQSTIWPRGYPLNKIAKPDVVQYRGCPKVNAFIQQGVVNGDPDIDAIYRLTRKDDGIQLDLSFDKNAQPLVIPHKALAPFNSQNTLFLNQAFFMLLLPQTTTFRVTDIWRGYWGQRLIWDVNGQLTFFAPNAYQKRTNHDYLLDFIDEKDLYHKSGNLVNFLLKWKSEKSHIFDRMLDLFVALSEAKFIEVDDVHLAKAWLMDLASFGYDIPPVADLNVQCSDPIVVKKPAEQASSYLKLGTKLVNLLAE